MCTTDFAYVGYSQGCANSIFAESTMATGTPLQQKKIKGLKARQLLFSAANGSPHGSCTNLKAQRLIKMGEEALKERQGFVSNEFIDAVLKGLFVAMDSSGFQKLVGGANSLLPEGVRDLWREAHNLCVPTNVLRGVIGSHNTPEALLMLSNVLTKQIGNGSHDSQVSVDDAVGSPRHLSNRNGDRMKSCDMGGSVLSVHHWAPLKKEVSYVTTEEDVTKKSFGVACDAFVFPMVEVGARFGFVREKKRG